MQVCEYGHQLILELSKTVTDRGGSIWGGRCPPGQSLQAPSGPNGYATLRARKLKTNKCAF